MIVTSSNKKLKGQEQNKYNLWIKKINKQKTAVKCSHNMACEKQLLIDLL